MNGFGFGEDAGRLSADECVLPVGLVPDGGDVDAYVAGTGYSLKLRFALPCEAVAHSQCILLDAL